MFKIIPRIDERRLPGSLWAMVTHFNPAGYTNKRTIFKRFYEGVHRQGLNVLIVELAEEDSGLELRDYVYPTDLYVPILSHKPIDMWQKEHLLNLSLKALPADCDKVMWMDSDIVFQNDGWVKKLCEQLEKYIVVQPFEYAIKLSPKGIVSDIDKIKWAHAWENHSSICNGFVASVIKYGQEALDTAQPTKWGHTGFTFAFRRSLIDRHGFFPWRIEGSGDTIMAYAILGNLLKKQATHELSLIGVEDEYERWATGLAIDIGMSFSYLPSDIILHIYHGSHQNRQYFKKKQLLKELNFKASKDLVMYNGQLLEWSELVHPQVRKYMSTYFRERKEHG